MDPAVIVDRSQGIAATTSLWRKLVPVGISFLGGSRLCIPGRCSTVPDSQLASKLTCSKMPLLRMNSQGDDELEYENRVASENFDFTSKNPQNNEATLSLFENGYTVPVLKRQSSPLQLASQFHNSSQYFHHAADAWTRNVNCPCNFVDTLSHHSEIHNEINSMKSQLISALEPSFAKVLSSNCTADTKCVVPDINRECSYNVGIPVSVTMSEKIQSVFSLSKLFSRCGESDISDNYPNKDMVQSCMTCSVPCLLPESKEGRECMTNRCIVTEQVGTHCQPESFYTSTCNAGKVRFLCRRKNSFNIRRHVSKCKQVRKVPVSCPTIEFRSTKEFSVVPVSNNQQESHLMSWFVQPSELHFSDSFGSYLDEEDDVELYSSSSAYNKTYNKVNQPHQNIQSSSCNSDMDEDNFIRFSPSAEINQDCELIFSDIQVVSPSCCTYISSCLENTGILEWNDEPPGDKVSSLAFISCSQEESEIDGVVIPKSSILKEINARWNKLYKLNAQVYPTESCLEKMTRVKFNNETSSITVLNKVEWAEDYEAARRGSWVQDRLHFDRRIRETEKQISWVFCAKHRDKQIAMYEGF